MADWRQGLRARLRYKADQYLGRSVYTLLTVTAVFVVLVLGLGAIRLFFVWFFADDLGIVLDQSQPGAGSEQGDNVGQLWMTWLEMTDPGTQAYDNRSSNWVKFFAVCSAVLGIVFLSAVIAIMTTALDRKIRELKEGNVEIIESDHTLVLGWNDRIVDILKELIEANESEPSATVVILADLDRQEMEEHLNVHVPDRVTTKIVTRKGVPSDRAALELVSPATARSHIVLRADEGCSTNRSKRADISVLKTIMALLVVCGDDSEVPIVAEMVDDDNIEITESLDPDRIIVVSADNMLGKIIAQCSRTVGLAKVYGEMLSFEGAELYFHSYEGAEPRRFGEFIWHLPDGIPIGYKGRDGEVLIHPDGDQPIQPGDELLIFAEDDSTIELLDERYVSAEPGSLPAVRGERRIERELLIGWTPKSATILREFADYLEDGSTIEIVTRHPDDEIRAEVEAVNSELGGLDVRLTDIDPHTSEGLNQLRLVDYDNVILLSQPGPECEMAEHTDTETLTIMLRLRRLFAERRPASTRLISEVMESTNDEVVGEAGAHDVVISNRLISSVIAQLSEDPDRSAVFESLFKEDGSEIYLKPAEWYFEELPVEVSLAEMTVQAAQRNEIALGYRHDEHADDFERNRGVTLNPDKRERVLISEGDTIVVVAEDEL